MMLLIFAVIVEGSRMMIAYQSAIGGVRDATRYLARVVPGNICAAGGTVTGYAPKLAAIVGQSTTGSAVFAPSVTVTSVTPSLACVGVAGAYRVSPAPVATVSAVVEIAFPFRGLFTLFGAGPSATLTTTVTDRAKVFGT
ncbi:MAG: pilus assembly protein [Albidovulum sp.]|nr:MAG: pilus assembly protein [Defluviimonas sp.]